VIDRDALARILGIGGAGLLAKMIELFLTNAPQRLAAARAGQRAGDCRAVGQAVHSLRSSAGNLGAGRLQDLAARIEELAEARQGEEIPVLLDELEQVFAQVKTCLEEERKGLDP
jgi:HPt (histidine-containing phosphotransfer) domain-containing protein